MERIMPPNMHVVSIKPDYTTTNDLVVHMVVATDSRDRAVELVKRMEKSSHFRAPQIVAEAVTTNASDQGAGPGNIQFDIAAVYVPQTGAADADEDKPEDAEERCSGEVGANKQRRCRTREPLTSAESAEAALMATIRDVREHRCR